AERELVVLQLPLGLVFHQRHDALPSFVEHDPFRKPVPTFRDHALGPMNGVRSLCGQAHGRPACVGSGFSLRRNGDIVRPTEEGIMQNSEKIWQLVDGRKDDYEALSDRVWGMPEIAYTEYRSMAEHRAMLEREGFRITEELAGIPTAVMGEAGEGGPVIAILG